MTGGKRQLKCGGEPSRKHMAIVWMGGNKVHIFGCGVPNVRLNDRWSFSGGFQGGL